MHSGDREPVFVYGINTQNPDFFFFFRNIPQSGVGYGFPLRIMVLFLKTLLLHGGLSG